MNVSELSTSLVYGAIAAYTVAMIAFAIDLSGLAVRRSEERPRRAAGIAMSTTWLAAGLHLLALVTRALAAGRVPWANMFEFTLMFTFVMVALFLGLGLRRDIRFMGAGITLLAVLGLGVAVSVLYVVAEGVEPILDSYWLVIHVSVATISVGLFTVAAVFAGLQLVQHRVERSRDGAAPERVLALRARRVDDVARRRAERAARAGVPAADGSAPGAGGTATLTQAAPGEVSDSLDSLDSLESVDRVGSVETADSPLSGPGGSGAHSGAGGAGGAGGTGGPGDSGGSGGRADQGPLARLMSNLPNAATLEAWCYRLSAVGFVTWTFTLVAGAIWAEHAWGRPWGWDPKETWTFVIWVIYAAYLHARATVGWTAEKFAYFSLVGFLALLANYYVVNIFIPGNHSYSGL